MATTGIAAAAAVVVVLALLGALVARRRAGQHRNTLQEVDSFARARSLTTQWATRPETSPRPVADAPVDARALGDAD